MDQAQLVARLLSEIAGTRAAITASHMRLWHSTDRSLIDAGAGERVREPQRDPDVGARAKRSPQDADQL